MSTPFIGEVRLVGFNFAPVGWSNCNGATLAISEYSTLYNLIGTTYGGNGQTTFQLPNLQGRIPVHQGSNGVSTYVLGQFGGAESVAINLNQYPTHSHTLSGSSNAGNLTSPGNAVVGGRANAYSADAPTVGMSPSVLGLSGGGGLAHENRQPFQVLLWIIALEGIYPSQN